MHWINVLQYGGVVLILMGQLTRVAPSTLLRSFMFTAVGSLILFVYSLLTLQYGYLTLNVVSVILAIKGWMNWRKVI